MGFKSSVKKAGKKAGNSVKSAGNSVKSVANQPVVQAAVTVGATALAGPAGAQVVNQSYSVMNAEGGILGKLNAAAATSGVAQISGLDLAQVLSTGQQYQSQAEEYVDTVTGYIQTSASVVNNVVSVKKKGLISTILDWIF